MTVFKKITFWLAIVSIVICVTDYYGGDDKHIPLIALNPFLSSVVYTQPFSDWIFNANNEIRFSAYIMHFSSFVLAGILIDLLVYLRKRKN